jgi:hypothetical protein
MLNNNTNNSDDENKDEVSSNTPHLMLEFDRIQLTKIIIEEQKIMKKQLQHLIDNQSDSNSSRFQLKLPKLYFNNDDYSGNEYLNSSRRASNHS